MSLRAERVTRKFVDNGEERRETFWIAYPEHFLNYPRRYRIEVAWGQGKTKEEALRDAESK